MSTKSTDDRPKQRVDFYFDVMCPWAYRTSLWFIQAAHELQLDAGWRFFSLEEVNRPAERPHPWQRSWPWGWSMLRVACVLRRQSQSECVEFYQAAGRALHIEGRKPQEREVLRSILTSIGQSPDLVDAHDESIDEEIRADHRRASAAGVFGVPTLHFPQVGGPGGTWHFGPVILRPPEGDQVAKLWRLIEGWLDFPHLYEMQRPKSPRDLGLIASEFQPYLKGRDWETIENPTP